MNPMFPDMDQDEAQELMPPKIVLGFQFRDGTVLALFYASEARAADEIESLTSAIVAKRPIYVTESDMDPISSIFVPADIMLVTPSKYSDYKANQEGLL